MDQKPLGRSGKTVSAIGLGCVTFGREIDEESSLKVLDYARERGMTFLDTAEAYGGGQSRRGRRESLGVQDEREVTGEMSSSERIIGDWMRDRGCRDEMTICTKVSTGASPENIKRAMADSLDRLNTDHVEIYKVHSPDDSVPISETLDALNDEVEAGRTGIIGGSNYSAKQIREAVDASESGGYARFQIMQPPYSIAAPEVEEDILPLCTKEGIAVTPYSPLAAGFLAGKYTPDKSKFPKGTRYDIVPAHADIYFTDRNFRIVERLRAKAEEVGVPMVRLAMAWAMTNPDVTAVLIGARTKGHIDNAIEAYEHGLDAELRAEMAAWD